MYRNTITRTILLGDVKYKIINLTEPAQITRLDVCDVENDYIDLNENFNNIEMKKKLRSFLYEKEYLEACGFCPGRKLSDPQIKPALQTKKPIKYERYIDQPD